jgi:hypothetical protein
MTVSLATRLSVPPDVLVSIVDDEAVLLNIKRERYFGLDRTGTAMWTALTTAESVEAAYQSLVGRFAVEPEILRRDLNDLVRQLIEHGLVESSPSMAGEGSLNVFAD